MYCILWLFRPLWNYVSLPPTPPPCFLVLIYHEEFLISKHEWMINMLLCLKLAHKMLYSVFHNFIIIIIQYFWGQWMLLTQILPSVHIYHHSTNINILWWNSQDGCLSLKMKIRQFPSLICRNSFVSTNMCIHYAYFSKGPNINLDLDD